VKEKEWACEGKRIVTGKAHYPYMDSENEWSFLAEGEIIAQPLCSKIENLSGRGGWVSQLLFCP